jgi:hypothetical protein
MKIISIYIMQTKTGWKYIVTDDNGCIAEGRIKGKMWTWQGLIEKIAEKEK